MKIAVLISGLCHSKHPSTSLKKNNERLREKFPTADFYYATYTQFEQTFKDNFDEECLFLIEPIIHYHPYDIAEEHQESKRYKETQAYINRTNNKEWSWHHTKQHLTHARLSDTIDTSKYDVIVRARFDTWIHKDADFTSYLEVTYNEGIVHGFAATKWKRGLSKLTQFDTSPFGRHYHWLTDQLIMYKPEQLDTSQVYLLHNQKRLHPAEMGWWQVLSKPNHNRHRCYDGWVNHDKHVLKGDFI